MLISLRMFVSTQPPILMLKPSSLVPDLHNTFKPGTTSLPINCYSAVELLNRVQEHTIHQSVLPNTIFQSTIAKQPSNISLIVQSHLLLPVLHHTKEDWKCLANSRSSICQHLHGHKALSNGICGHFSRLTQRRGLNSSDGSEGYLLSYCYSPFTLSVSLVHITDACYRYHVPPFGLYTELKGFFQG